MASSPCERASPPPRSDAGCGHAVTADHKNYAGYQTKTTREIPLVLLEPVE